MVRLGREVDYAECGGASRLTRKQTSMSNFRGTNLAPVDAKIIEDKIFYNIGKENKKLKEI